MTFSEKSEACVQEETLILFICMQQVLPIDKTEGWDEFILYKIAYMNYAAGSAYRQNRRLRWVHFIQNYWYEYMNQFQKKK